MFPDRLQLCVISATRTYRCMHMPSLLLRFACERLVIRILFCIQDTHVNISFVVACMLASTVQLSVDIEIFSFMVAYACMTVCI